jgi:hypothetical protein
MRQPSPAHDQLISLRRVRLDGRELAFRQAVLSLTAQDNVPSWSCTLRGAPIEEMHRLQGEVELRAQAIDARSIEGRVAIPSSLWDSEAPDVFELVGLDSLLIEGRKL